MNRQVKKPNRLLLEIHEIAQGMLRVGAIDDARMREYDTLCLEPVQPFSKTKIQALRKRNHLSQVAFASMLNASVSTVRQWEIGAKKPSGPSLKLLSILDRKGIEVFL